MNSEVHFIKPEFFTIKKHFASFMLLIYLLLKRKLKNKANIQ